MSAIAMIATGFFVFGYVLIALEQRFNTHKTAIALIMAGLLWILAALDIRNQETVTQAANTTGIDVFNIIAFSIASMALIEILVHYRFFDMVRIRLLRLGLADKQQFLLMMAMTFMLSSVLDNISVTIAMLQVGRRFFEGKNLLIVATGIVIAANAGGAWSPIGDVTSLLLWLSGKLTPIAMISHAILPSIVLMIVSGGLLYRSLEATNFDKHEADENVTFSLGEKLIITMALISFVLPVFVNIIGIPPYLGRFFGLGMTWALIELAKSAREPKETHLGANIEKILQLVDLASIKFITGILLSVGALSAMGVLTYFSQTLLGPQPSDGQLITANIGLGLLSSIVDNSSLVAIAIKVFDTTNPELWGLTAVLAGTGGSLLSIGSAAGVVAMGSVKQLNFKTYLKHGTVPALAGFAAAIVTWYIQSTLV